MVAYERPAIEERRQVHAAIIGMSLLSPAWHDDDAPTKPAER